MPAMPNPDAAIPRVALFRAREDAAGSAARLSRLGFAVASLPAIECVPLAFALRRARYDAVIATSGKAFASDALADRASPLFVAGARTARAAEARGWRLAAEPAPDSARLVEILKETIPPGAAVLYLAGRDRKPTLEAALGGFCALEIVEAYVVEARKRWRRAEIRALDACAAALHYSRRSAFIAAELAETAGAGARFRLMSHVCLSDDVASPLAAFGAADIRIAAKPEEAALFATLMGAAPLFPSLSPSRI